MGLPTTEQIVLITVLRKFATSELGDSQAIILVEETGDTVSALVASPKFAGTPYGERQRKLWEYVARQRGGLASLPPISFVKTIETPL